MNPVLRKQVLSQALLLCRAPACSQLTAWGGVAQTQERRYRGSRTEGIGRWRHLLSREAPKKKKDKHQMQSITAPTSVAYGTLNVNVSGYDMTVVEHYAQYIHNLCNRLGISVAESYALPTQSTEVMLMQESGTKMYVDSLLKTHKRVIQLSSLKATLCPVLMDVLVKNQPEGVNLSVKEHTEADFLARFKARPELEGLVAQIGQ
ncbi:39S ribosomal protein L48, mitochondrial isoform X1 [Hippocampus zosterae]|uniref:39S ribosomal protein L48, mitochondrial isoform X1 n=1 Tax=Hippocampus zosterae TaxID=109293 RepID=UPI00223D1F18|nr:39S ribosomal protein L48, mitochondrial isoform X1 [Hippocampus zosterae]